MLELEALELGETGSFCCLFFSSVDVLLGDSGFLIFFHFVYFVQN